MIFFDSRISQDPCPASVWLLGTVTGCIKHKGHDGPHRVILEWRTDVHES